MIEVLAAREDDSRAANHAVAALAGCLGVGRDVHGANCIQHLEARPNDIQVHCIPPCHVLWSQQQGYIFRDRGGMLH